MPCHCFCDLILKREKKTCFVNVLDSRLVLYSGVRAADIILCPEFPLITLLIHSEPFRVNFCQLSEPKSGWSLSDFIICSGKNVTWKTDTEKKKKIEVIC